jgi:hypothetical protein
MNRAVLMLHQLKAEEWLAMLEFEEIADPG